MSINYFDEIFFRKYINEEDEVLDVCHRHLVKIVDTIIIWVFFWAILPSFFYYNNSFESRDLIPFIYFEAYLFITYTYLIYSIFDWYNDVWIVTNKWIIDLDRTFFKTKIIYIDYNDVRWIEIEQTSPMDWFIGKWDIVIHLGWDKESFALQDAKNPTFLANYIQWVLEDREKSKKEKEKTINDKLLNTVKWVIRDFLEKEGNWVIVDEDEVEESPEEKAINKILNKTWTIDLRKI